MSIADSVEETIPTISSTFMLTEPLELAFKLLTTVESEDILELMTLSALQKRDDRLNEIDAEIRRIDARLAELYLRREDIQRTALAQAQANSSTSAYSYAPVIQPAQPDNYEVVS